MTRDVGIAPLASALDALPILGLVVDRGGTILAASPRWEPVLRYRSVELEGRALSALVHAEDRAQWEAAVDAVSREGEGAGGPIEVRLRCAGGEFSWISARLSSSEGLILVAGTELDAEKRYVEALCARLHLVDASGAAIVARDPSGRITSWSPGAERLYGYSACEASGAVLAALLDRREPSGRDDAAHAGGPWRVELGARTKDGRRLVVEHVFTIMTDAAGHPAGVVETHFDVTARVEAAARRAELLSTASHELRTPLTSIRGALGLLDAGLVGELPDEARALVKVAHESSERLVRLLNGLLDLEKLDAGKLELARRDLDATALVERARTLMQGLSDQRRVPIELFVTEPLRVSGDEERLLQVLTNLLSNALKYSPEGTPVVVSVARGSRPERVRVSVRDRGPGISPENVGRLFQRFQQLDPAAGKGGTGLGLAISKALVEQHGGELGVESAVGQGTELWFELALVGGVVEAPKVRDSARATVLVLSSDGEGTALRALVDASVFELVVARDRVEAEDALATRSPRAILVDLDAAPEASDAALGSHLPRIAIGTDPVPILEAPFVDRVPRPIDRRRLDRALRRATLGQEAPRVLIIDDDAAVRAVVEALLRPLAIECLHAADGLEGIQRARVSRPDLIILDVDMPRATGFDVVAVLRQEVLASTPLLVHSARELTEAERAALTLGVTRWVVKARVSDRELVEVVRELLLDVAEPFDAGRTHTFAVPSLE